MNESPASPLADEVTRLRHENTALRARLAEVEAAERRGAERAAGDQAWEQAAETVRRVANQPKNKPILSAFGGLLDAVRFGTPAAMVIAEAVFWEALEARDRALLDTLNDGKA